jgi:hypothetical protein
MVYAPWDLKGVCFMDSVQYKIFRISTTGEGGVVLKLMQPMMKENKRIYLDKNLLDLCRMSEKRD